MTVGLPPELRASCGVILPSPATSTDGSLPRIAVPRAPVLHLRDPIPDAHHPPTDTDLAAFHTALLEAVDQSVILTDLEGRIQTWNAAATRIFGYTSEQIVGHSVAELYPDVDAAELAQDLGRILAGQDFVGEWLGRRQNGSS